MASELLLVSAQAAQSMIRSPQTFRQQSSDERAAPQTTDDLSWRTVPHCVDVEHLIAELKVFTPCVLSRQTSEVIGNRINGDSLSIADREINPVKRSRRGGATKFRPNSQMNVRKLTVPLGISLYRIPLPHTTQVEQVVLVV
jgi:hypothetical protein